LAIDALESVIIGMGSSYIGRFQLWYWAIPTIPGQFWLYTTDSILLSADSSTNKPILQTMGRTLNCWHY